MDTPTVPSSFIPKKPVTSTGLRGGSGAVGTFLMLIVMLVFIASMLAAVAAFFYQKYLQGAIVTKSNTLQNVEDAFDPGTIDQLTRLGTRMSSAKTLLDKHITVLGVFNFLSLQTLPNVQFTQFDYEPQPDGSAKVSLSGVADSFATVALQSDQFGASKLLKDVAFSSIAVASDGKITFTVAATADPSLLSYKDNLSSLPSITAPTSSQNTGTTTMTTTTTSSTTHP